MVFSEEKGTFDYKKKKENNWKCRLCYFSWCVSPLLQKKVVEQLRKELLVKQEPETKLQLHVQAPPVGGDIKSGNLLQSQQIPGGLQQVGNTHSIPIYQFTIYAEHEDPIYVPQLSFYETWLYILNYYRHKHTLAE